MESQFLAGHCHDQQEQGKATNIALTFTLADSGISIFQPDGSEGGSAAFGSEPTATPPPPEPLTLAANLYPDFPNSAGWRDWSTEISFSCSGGTGAVTCPPKRYLESEGVNQSFTFEASDEAGNVATVALNGINVDRTPPQLTETLPESQTFCSTAALTLDFSVSDNLSGLLTSNVTFNGQPVADGDSVTLRPGLNILAVDAEDAAGNRALPKATVLVNYAVTTSFPPDGQPVDPTQPLPFHFSIANGCSAAGLYGSALATLDFIGPDGVELPAVWANGAYGNAFLYDSQNGRYTFEADVSGLAAGQWIARVSLDDGTERTVSFVVP
ncbi:MAG: hypothetical protein AB1791_16735 [Chloroflexota bacterium]